MTATRAADERDADAPPRFGTYELFYKNADELCVGDVVHGWVELNLTRQLVVQRMTVTFYGQVDYETSRRLHTYCFETQTQELWRQPHLSENGALLERGFYVYEFFVGTRLDLPRGFIADGSSALRSLVYYCEVRVSERAADGRLTDHVKRRPLLLRPAAAFRPNALDGRAVVERGVLYVRNLFDMSGCVAATVLVGRRLHRPGDNVYFDVEILNCFRRLTISAALVQRAMVVRKDGSCYAVSHHVCRLPLAQMKSADTFKQLFAESVWIPDTKRVPVDVRQLQPRRVISLGYELLVVVKPQIGKALQVTVPLVVRDVTARIPATAATNGTVFSGAQTL